MMSDGTTYTDRIYAAEDGAYTSGRSGLIAYVHIVSYTAEGVSPTFDNFYSGTTRPATEHHLHGGCDGERQRWRMLSHGRCPRHINQCPMFASKQR